MRAVVRATMTAADHASRTRGERRMQDFLPRDATRGSVHADSGTDRRTRRKSGQGTTVAAPPKGLQADSYGAGGPIASAQLHPVGSSARGIRSNSARMRSRFSENFANT